MPSEQTKQNAVDKYWKVIDVVKRHNQNGWPQLRHFEVKGTIFRMSDNCFYPSCIFSMWNGLPCRKKVEGRGRDYHCEKCDKSMEFFRYAVHLYIEIGDADGAHWVTLFTEQAEQLLGISADDLYHLKEASEEKYQDVFDEVMRKTFVFSVEVRRNTYYEQPTTSWICHEVTAIDCMADDKVVDGRLSQSFLVL